MAPCRALRHRSQRLVIPSRCSVAVHRALGDPFERGTPRVSFHISNARPLLSLSSKLFYLQKIMIVCGNETRRNIDLTQLPLVQSDQSTEATPEPLRQRLEMGGNKEGGQLADGQRFAVLSYEQVSKLDAVMEEVMPIHGRGNFPTLEVRLKDLVKVVRAKLESEQSVQVRDIRLNGGAASHVLAPETSTYNDLDLIFAVDLSNPRNFDKVKTAVLDSLLDFLPEGVVKKRISTCSLKEAYVHKMVKVTNGDRWSLISLSNNRGRNIELKFVDSMRRQFEFSVDSFQIILDSLLLFYGCSQMAMSENFYPTVVAESVYGDFQEALYHLHKKLIATRNPEEIRGGGLLKYCNLLVRDYKPAMPEKIKHLERYMCSRFFIDFGDINQQRSKLENYLANHFMGEEQNKYEYLLVLHRVVDESTVCLMGHERRQSLALIEELACRTYYFEHQAKDLFQPHPHIVFGGGFFFTPYAPYPCSCSWMPCT